MILFMYLGMIAGGFFGIWLASLILDLYERNEFKIIRKNYIGLGKIIGEPINPKIKFIEEIGQI